MPSALSVLGYLLQAAPYLAAALLGVLLPVLAVFCYSRFGAGVAVICTMFAIEALYMDVGGIQLGITIYATDFVLLFVGIVAGLRLVFADDVPRFHWGWVLFGLAFFVSFGLGLGSYGTGAGVQARPYFYLLAAGSYGLSFGIDAVRLRLLLNTLVAMALLLMGLSAYRWLVYYLPITELLPPGGAYNNDGAIRVIRSYEAVVLAEVLVLGVFLSGGSRALAFARILAPLLLGFVVVLQHRSAWIAGIAGVMGTVLIARSKKSKPTEQILLIAAIVTVTALPMIVSDQLAEVNQQVGASAGSAIDGRGTTGERAESWGVIVGQWSAAGPRSIVIGQSFGTDPARYVHEQDGGGVRKLVYGAHNFYVQTLFNTGLVGLLSFLFATVYIVRGLYRICAAGTEGLEANALLALVIMQLSYYVPYGADYLQSLIFGTALAYVATHRTRESAGRAAGTTLAHRSAAPSRSA